MDGIYVMTQKALLLAASSGNILLVSGFIGVIG